MIPLAVLIVEDVDHKYLDVLAALESCISQPVRVTRAKTMVEAELALEDSKWDLVVLDISMDISPGSRGPMRDGHANLAGMDILETMYLTERETPTIIVTGFDYFISSGTETDVKKAETFGELELKAREHIGTRLLGCVRYGISGWQATFTACIERFKQ